ncbi:MAG: phage major tail tube protein [Tolumonas sp.]
MALPKKLKQMNLFNDGENWIGIIEEFTPAKLTRKFEKYRGGGMPGAADIDLGFDDGALEIEFTIGGFELKLLQQSANSKHDGVPLRFAGAYQRDDTGDVSRVEIVSRGRIKELDSGNLKVGDNSQTKVSMTNTYYKVMVDGSTVVEVDTVNMIHIVDGVDMMADYRKAIGL